MLSLVLISSALAEEAKFVGAAADAPATGPETRVVANVGGNFSSGNSESVSFTASVDAQHKWRRNRLGVLAGANVAFGAVDANADGFLAEAERCLGFADRECSSTAERYSIDGRYDRFLSKRDSLYVLAGAFHDPFAGFELRAHGQLGYARALVDAQQTNLDLEAGVDFANEQYVEGVVPASANLVAAQLALRFDHAFNESVSFADALVVYEPILTQPDGSPFAPHLTDLRVSNSASITAKMSERFSVSVTDTLNWRNEPVAAPEGIDESRAHVDNTLTVALVASIL